MNIKLLKLKKELVKAIKPSKEDIQATNIKKAIEEARANKDDIGNRKYYLNKILEAFIVE